MKSPICWIVGASLLGACTSSAVEPMRVDSIEPAQSVVGQSAFVTLSGHFPVEVHVSFRSFGHSMVLDSFRASVGSTTLTAVSRIDESTLTASLPGSIPMGLHDVEVVDSVGRAVLLPEAFAVVAEPLCDSDAECIDACRSASACVDGVCELGPVDLDVDGDGLFASSCGGSDCDDTIVGCTTDCTDADGDGLAACAGDCDDSSSTCTTDCTDADGDGLAACAGDCDDGLPMCVSDCTDADGDGYCVDFDCNDSDPSCSADCAACPSCTVTSAQDSGVGSFRECIAAANLTPGTTIYFALPGLADQQDGAGSWWRLALSSALPEITAAGTTVDGDTQALFATETNPLGPEVEIHGAAAGDTSGLILRAESVVVRGLAVNAFARNGIEVVGPQGDGAAVEGCVVGVAPTGLGAAENQLSGIYVSAPSVTVGGVAARDGNLVAFNRERGVFCDAGATGCRVEGNEIREQGYAAIISTADDVVIVRNLIRHNSTRNPWDEIVINAGANVQLINNTVYGSPGDGVHVAAPGVMVHNNIIVGNAGYGIILAGGSIVESHNLITDGLTAPVNALGQLSAGSPAASDHNADPEFADASAGDFSLGSCSSVAANGGLDLGAGQPDLNGAAAGLYTGSMPDIGAIESDCP